ncbi:Programmed cell death protein 2-like [Thalictrum thalictroides]|uniref:Programmed cell death protein 2-like n=1 Tax=Thalictrum thalictroides TaxID=46969 RepID=A0A7J6VY48_THATH|nr:Programmed cell death protein 2-like [Thalictrum thalictroides]
MVEEMGKVILGMPGPWAKNYREVADHYTTKIGGLPDWPIPDLDVGSLECAACGSRLCLVVQLYAPVSGDALNVEERIIYVFGCTMQNCGSNPLSWRVLRVQKLKSEEESSSHDEVISLETSSAPVSSDHWQEDIWTHDSGELVDDVNNDDFDLEELGRALSEAANLVSHSRKQRETIKQKSPFKSVTRLTESNIPVLPCFYIYSQEESLSRHVTAVCSIYSSLSIKGKECDLDDRKEEETWEEESYEYDRALFVDRTFLKFKKRMDSYPEQCFRYSYGGKPLLASKELEVPARCACCGGFRHYEMQLMPPLLYFLREASDGSLTSSPEHWNWMTLVVYTCSQNCSHQTHKEDSGNNRWTVAEETVVAQFE